MKGIIRKSLEKKYPQAVEPALRTFNRGYEEVKFQTFRNAVRDGDAWSRRVGISRC